MSIREIIFCIALLIWTFSYFSFVTPLSASNKKLEEEIQILKAQQQEQSETLSQLQAEYNLLQQKNPVAIEKVLRTKYHYCKEGETVATFEK